jgi:hypothetical protein
MKKGDIIKRKFKCSDGKVRIVDCLVVSAFVTKQREMHPVTFQPIGEWRDCISGVVKWVDINGKKRIDNITL